MVLLLSVIVLSCNVLSCIFSAPDTVNPLDPRGNYSATWNNMKLVHWPLMGRLLHLVQRGGDWAGPQPYRYNTGAWQIIWTNRRTDRQNSYMDIARHHCWVDVRWTAYKCFLGPLANPSKRIDLNSHYNSFVCKTAHGNCLKIFSNRVTDRSFRWYASARLWNQLPDSFRQRHKSCLD